MHKDQLTPQQIAELKEQLRRDSAELDAIMLDHAKRVAINSKSYLLANDIAKLTGLGGAHLEQWKRDKLIFAFNHGGVDYFPAYALDPHNGKPYAAVAKILEIFGGENSGWGCAFWFEGVNGRLGGKAPKDLIATDPDLVIKAALLEIQPISHG
jgi:hypothetical protein